MRPLDYDGDDLNEGLLTHTRKPSTHEYARPKSWLQRWLNNKRRLTICFIAFLALLLLSIIWSLSSSKNEPPKKVQDKVEIPPSVGSNTTAPASGVKVINAQDYLLGQPTARFRDNLKADQRYITSWPSAGWTNDVMTYMNIIYLAMLTERIPVIPMFTPSHVSGGTIDFGEVFDVPRLEQALNMPVLEWHQVKARDSNEEDELGCWSTWMGVQHREPTPRGSPAPDLLKLDISYTAAPAWIKSLPHVDNDVYANFWGIAALAFPEQRENYLKSDDRKTLASLHHNVTLPPDEQMLCHDYLFYVCANQPFEYEFDYSPVWRFVGKHLHWTDRIRNLADQYVRRTLGVSEGDPTPHYIAIHIRHGDFRNLCGDVPVNECFAPVSVIGRRVEEVKKELQERKGITVNHVIMTSDERDASWWEEVRAQGWYSVDHSETSKLLGPWYPVFIDAAIQSLGMGFVGTDGSTMTTLARRRTESWSDGATRVVKWGKPGADDH